MRRSAAPSFRADVKKARFLQHISSVIPSNEKENISNKTVLEPLSTSHAIPSSNVPADNLNVVAKEKNTFGSLRSNEDILDLIMEADSTSTDISENVPKNSDGLIKTDKVSTGAKPLKHNVLKKSMQNNIGENCDSTLSTCIYCIKNTEEASLFNVVYCKRSGKKHKTWEGDGLLLVRSRSAVLKDMNGKTIDRGVGYKTKEIESLEEGSKFFVGGKECEIQFKVPEEECQSGKYCKCDSNTDETPIKEEKSPVQIKRPC